MQVAVCTTGVCFHLNFETRHANLWYSNNYNGLSQCLPKLLSKLYPTHCHISWANASLATPSLRPYLTSAEDPGIAAAAHIRHLDLPDSGALLLEQHLLPGSIGGLDGRTLEL